jgi:TolB-like protein
MENVRSVLGRSAFVLLLLVATAFHARAQEEKPRIAVLPFQAVEVPQSVSMVISALFETNLVNTKAYTVLSHSDRDRILEAQADSFEDYADEDYAIQIGKLLSTEQIIIGTVAALGSKYIINAKIIDVTTSETLGAGSISAASVEELDVACARLTESLVTGAPPGPMVVESEAAPATVFDEDQLNFVTLSNLTTDIIEFVFLSPGDSEYWGAEILGTERVLGPGESVGFFIHYPNECDLFDIMAVNGDDETIFIYDYEICDGREELVQFINEDLTDQLPEMDLVTIDIRNDIVPIHYLFISPGDSDMWGIDFLGEEATFDSGGTVSFLFPTFSEPITYDLMAVDEDGDVYRFSFDIDTGSDGTVFPIEFTDIE